MSAEGSRPVEELRDRNRTWSYVASIVINLIMLYIVNHVLAWEVPFLTPAFSDVLWAINLSLWATIIANTIFLAYDARWFRDFAQIILSGIALGVTAILYARFPFDFGSPSFNELASIALIVVMVAVIIAIVVQVIVFFAHLARQAA